MIDGKNFFDQPVRNDKVTYEIIIQPVVYYIIPISKNITK